MRVARKTITVTTLVRVEWESDRSGARHHALQQAHDLVRRGGAEVAGAHVKYGYYSARIIGLAKVSR